MANVKKVVLVSAFEGQYKRRVTFTGSKLAELLPAVKEKFADVESIKNGNLNLQMWFDSLNDYSDLEEDDDIPAGTKFQLKVIDLSADVSPSDVNGGNKQSPPAPDTILTTNLPLLQQIPLCGSSLQMSDHQEPSSPENVQHGCGQPGNFWRGREVLFVYFINPAELLSGYGQVNLQTIIEWMGKWADPYSGDIPRFERTRKIEDADIRVKFVEGSKRCWSKVGTEAEVVGEQEPTMELSLKGYPLKFQKFLVIHEFGHALGLEHEHQSYDFWSIASDVLDIQKMKADYRMKGIDLDKDILEHRNSRKFETTSYDADSVMHYWFDVNWLKHDKHKTVLGVDSDEGLTPEQKIILKGIHKRSNSFAERPSRMDMEFLKYQYEKKRREPRSHEQADDTYYMDTSAPPAPGPAPSTRATANTCHSLTKSEFEKLDDKSMLELVDDVTQLDADDAQEVLSYLNTDTGHWENISMNLHVKSGKITELRNSGRPPSTCLAQAVTDWLLLNYNHQRFGNPTWKKVAESVLSVNKRLSLTIAFDHVTKNEANGTLSTDSNQGGSKPQNKKRGLKDSNQRIHEPQEKRVALEGSSQSVTEHKQDSSTVTYPVLTIDDNLRSVKEAVWDVREKWNKIGEQLGVDNGTIRCLAKDRSKDDGECLHDVLSTWMHTGEATIDQLLNALENKMLGCAATAKAIRNRKGSERVKVGLPY